MPMSEGCHIKPFPKPSKSNFFLFIIMLSLNLYLFFIKIIEFVGKEKPFFIDIVSL